MAFRLETLDPNTASAIASLDERPRAEVWSVEDLVRSVSKGRVRVPRFQRGLRWNANDARLLFDSIYRGYPIGTLLFWQRLGEAGQETLGPLTLDVPQRSDALFVVDGQQRIIALASALLLPPEEADRFGLYFDLDQKKFVRRAARRRLPDHWIPLNEALDSERLMAWLMARPEVLVRYQSVALALGRRIREYQVTAYVVETSDERILRNVFTRLNMTGKQIEASEVFDALLGDEREDPPTLAALAKNVGRQGFGNIEPKLLFKALRGMAGLDIGSSSRWKNQELPGALSALAHSLQRVVTFLRVDAGIPHFELLPYESPVIVLARFFDRHPEPSSRSRELVSRWLWRGAISGAHRGETVGTRAMLAQVGDDEDASVQALIARSGAPSESPERGSFDFRHARSKIDVLALLDLGPRSFVDGRRVAIGDVLHSRHREKIPRLLSSGKEAGGVFRSAANRVLHPGIPGRTLEEALIAAEDPEVAKSHAVSSEALERLRAGDRKGFLDLRAALIDELVSSFRQKKARWGETDRPPLSALMVPDEE